MHHFSLVLNEFGYPSTDMMGTVVKWRVMDVVYPAFSKWTVKWTENCLNEYLGTEPYSARGQSLLVARGLILGPQLFNLIVNEPG